ncbi:hypothetical protein [Aestuariimicrobium ganziense]|uniref:hypothetical protein n=1 Tax=Aestuariimicrobium ganziense TaxID=2773677 RepID=UPI001944AB01|nr:hypothetical protein [Aestuariimicrobium ganziense]
MNQTTRRALLGAGLVAAGLVGKAKLGDDPTVPTTQPPQSSAPPGPNTAPPSSEAPSSPETPQEPTAPTGFIAWTQPTQPQLRPAGRNAGEPIRTAHHDFTIPGFASVDRLTLTDVANLEGNQVAMRAPADSEFVCVQLRAGQPPWGSDIRSTLEIVVGPKRTRLDKPFGDYSKTVGEWTQPDRGVVILAKRNEPVQLRIVDAGKTALYDLRKGKRATDAGTNAFNGFLTRAEVSAKPTSGTWSRTFRTNDRRFIAESDTLRFALDGQFSTTLVPWTPSAGWAPERQLWLQIQLTPQYQYSEKPQRPLNPTCTIDLSKSYVLTPDSGVKRTGKTSVGKVKGQDYVLSYDKPVTVTWSVPSYMRSATIVANLVVSDLVVRYTNGTASAAFTQAPKVPTFAITITR